MPWNDQNGGGNGGWQGGGDNRGPWGKPPKGGGNGNGQQPPDLEELIAQGQEKLRGIFGGGKGDGSGAGGIFAIVGLILVAFLGFSSVYRVDTDQQGVVLRFGEYVRTERSGLHFKLPYPIEVVYKPTVTQINSVPVGLSAGEGLMLTGDENIVDINFTVQWQIKEAESFLFNVAAPERAVKAVAESTMREVVGQSALQALLTTDRNKVQQAVTSLVQATLDSYKAGILITEVKLGDVRPPQQVNEAFQDVQAAKADQERAQNVADAYANSVIPEARGEAAKITQAADAYREQTVAEAQGEAARFLAIYNEYKAAKGVTRERMYLETMEKVLSSSSKIVIDNKGGAGVLPYLPLNGLSPKAASGSAK
ncbi:MAG: membrane protease subunit HflK [Parvibaculaceae bacterium]|mgnify:CR=1 FL=1|jgi:membrane protease subunit HflK|nr:FtsH protease activity modulator HflK [Parvibaculaceae bacterium]